MPNMPPKPCRYSGCPNAHRNKGAYCDDHKKAKRRQDDKRRGSAHSRGYSYRWGQYSKSRLERLPLCVRCLEQGNIKRAVITDHIVPHNGPNDPLFWDVDNHQSLCKRCHDIKTATEDGGFGNE